METFNAFPYILPMICWPCIPIICIKMCGKYEEKKNWNIQRMGDDFDECLYFKRSFMCCCVIFCDCCCSRLCGCIWLSEKDAAKKDDKINKIVIAELEGSMGIAADKSKMSSQEYIAYLKSKKQMEDDAREAASKPPPSRTVRDIKLMIVQSMIENGNSKDALDILKDLDSVQVAQIEQFREETPTSLRTKGLRVVAGVLQVVSVINPIAGVAGAAVGYAADVSEWSDKRGSKKSEKSGSAKSPVQAQPAEPPGYQPQLIAPVTPPAPVPAAAPALAVAVAVPGPADPSFEEFLEYQKFLKAKTMSVQNPMQIGSPSK